MQPHDLAWAAGQIITFDGDTLLTYDADTEAPRWLATLDADITALAASDQLLVVATDDKALRGCDPQTGTEIWRHAIDGAGLSVAVEGIHWAVAFTDTVLRGDGANVGKSYPASGVEVVALGPSDALAVGTAEGLSVVRPDGVAQTGLDNISGVTRAPDGGWYVTAGAKLFHLDEALDVVGGAQMSETAFSMPVVSPSGRYVAVRVDDDYVSVYTTNGLKQAGWIAYTERSIGAIAFGPKNWLSVAVGDGHANKIHLGDGMISRTDEHPGRERSSWMLSYKADDDYWGASQAAGGVGPTEATAPEASDAQGSPAMTVVGLVVAAVVGVAVYFLMQ
ncbi:MAG: hypothetical protein ACI9U2_004624 [Bradymonadia bacterium]|jgi:hypothetical protein